LLELFQKLVGAAAIGGRARKRETRLYAFSFVSFSFAPAASKEKRKTL
jgi:hypothetical protein